jgi:hypothetical protein
VAGIVCIERLYVDVTEDKVPLQSFQPQLISQSTQLHSSVFHIGKPPNLTQSIHRTIRNEKSYFMLPSTVAFFKKTVTES